MTVLTITYGDADPTVRSLIGDDIRGMLASFDSQINPPEVSFLYYCDRFTGEGWWNDENGEPRSEHSGVIVVDTRRTLTPRYRLVLRLRLSRIAAAHHQEAIGLVIAPSSELVAP